MSKENSFQSSINDSCFCRSVAHDYEAVHNATETEESGIFKNFNYHNQETSESKTVTSYSDIMKNNNDLLASHMASMVKEGSEDEERSNDSDTNQLVNTTNTSQVSLS